MEEISGGVGEKKLAMVDRGGHHHCWKLEKVSCLRAVLGPNGGGLVRVMIIGVSEPSAWGAACSHTTGNLPVVWEHTVCVCGCVWVCVCVVCGHHLCPHNR